jgi:hypothetical protein
LRAAVTLIYLQRKVNDARSYVEGEQTPLYVQNSVTTRGVPIMYARDVRKPSWRIRMEGQDKRNFVFLAAAFGQENPLDFSTFERANDFAAWLNAHAAWLHRGVKHGIGKNGNWLSWAALDSTSPFPTGTFIADRFDDTASPDECSGMDTAPVGDKKGPE